MANDRGERRVVTISLMSALSACVGALVGPIVQPSGSSWALAAVAVAVLLALTAIILTARKNGGD